MPTTFIRNESENDSLAKRVLGLLPLSLKRHILYLRKQGRWGNFRSPQLFTEKMQWRIINDRRELLRTSCDRRANRDTVERACNAAGLSIELPALVAWSDTAAGMMEELRRLHAEERLPKKWVLKPNNSSGRAAVTEGEPDFPIIEATLREWAPKGRFHSLHWIWPYVQATPGFIAEGWVGPINENPEEWTIWMAGEKACFYLLQQRIGDGRTARGYFDGEWKDLGDIYKKYAVSPPIVMPAPPPQRELMDRFATAIAQPWDFLRVDLFFADDKVWFGELTPFPWEGIPLMRDIRETIDLPIGTAWQLPSLESVREGQP
ncbi:MAG: ATP-grasp fold amidoligase family protein [Chloroflexota bacterium]|jgi:hypothetical protein